MITARGHIRSEEFSPEPERYELRPRLALVTRRELFRTVGCGLAVLCLIPEACAQEIGGTRRRGPAGSLPQDIGAWLLVGANGAVTGYTGKVEVGQNARTSLTQVIAEELRVPVASVTMVMGDTELTPFDMGTFGSRTTPTMVPQLRRAAAAARESLLDMAAAMLHCDRSTLRAENGTVRTSSGQSVTYGELTAGKRLTKTISADVTLRPPAEWQVEGHPVPKVNGREIVTGAHRYASDIRRTGMLFGRVVRPSAFEAKLVSVDDSAATKMPGVTVVKEGDFVAVTAPDQFTAALAAAAVSAKWQAPEQISVHELYDYLRSHPSQERGGFGGGGGRPQGDISAALSSADVKLNETYTIAYIAHCPLEPRAAVAEWQGDNLTVWTGTQRPFGVRGELAAAFNIPESQVHVIMPDTGSGYGGKHTGECAVEAARMAKSTGKPVKLVWTREEEFTWAYFRPAGVIEVASGASRNGALAAWEFHNYN
ncbi:MAG TPA: molybdopterin cofactor-binding domain-containing protein, partial [Chthonomonadales bacterium]|nr:molybdopterin cofactor-binding domain-containing protein [Chthonomonadales bacterium]